MSLSVIFFGKRNPLQKQAQRTLPKVSIFARPVVKLKTRPCSGQLMMTTEIRNLIQRMVDYETLGWDTKDPEPFLSMIHPDMAWPFAPNADAHDPIDWVFIMGRFDEEQWRRDYQGLFATHDLIHNRRSIVKIEIAPTEDAAFAVVDIDTLWRSKETGEDFPWKGRVCKIYSKLRTGDWKFYWQTSALNFPLRQNSSGI